MTASSLMNRVRALLDEKGLSQASFARKIDVSPQALSAWLSGRNRPGIDEVERMCAALQVSPSWLITGRVDDPAHQSLVSADWVSIPLMDVKASCGNGRELSNAAVVQMIQVNRPWVSRHCGAANPRALNIIGVSGDSMSPTLEDGDFVILDTSVNSVYTDSIFAFIFSDELFIKRIQRVGKSLNIISDNHLYQTYTLSPPDIESGFKILGRVVTTCLVRKI